ncbi:sialate O-acetylesterase [Mucilaginibacter litoreus]|uniref:Sialate O-acetylesterase n=1 Tax=Mucilaginibacter litoreus TaxID=1048221 RepID=A0ABW3AY32_9SPHI
MKSKLLMLALFAAVITGCSKKDVTPPDDTKPVTPPEDGFYVANTLQSNMVVQRNKPFVVWGSAKPGQTVTVNASWSQQAVSKTDASGYWQLTLPSAAANAAPQKITISTNGEKPIELNNILIGDVWICAGQSNMNMPLGNIAPFTGVENYETEIANANQQLIRFLTVKESYSASPIEQLATPAQWQVCSPDNAAGLSAVAYYFARRVQQSEQVPIGIIVSAVNGSWAETWANSAAIQNDPFLAGQYYGAHQSSQLFNGMINPFVKLGISGFIWYQGENNQKTSPPSTYTKLNIALINGWREVFKQGDLPFYYVQLTPFDDDKNGNEQTDWLAKFREAQAAIRNGVSNSGMAVTMDAGEVDNHHPKYKKQVGERLALLALKNAYGRKVASVGPKYQSFSQLGNIVTIHYVQGTAQGLSTKDGTALKQYFFVAGADKILHTGTAVINGDHIDITVPADLSLPVVEVRYAFTNFPVTNLQNAAGLPAEPFDSSSF